MKVGTALFIYQYNLNKDYCTISNNNQTLTLKNIHYRLHKTATTLPILKTTAKAVQTTRVVCTNFSRSLYRLQLKSPESTMYLLI